MDQISRTCSGALPTFRGAKPGNIPVEQPTKFDLIINLTLLTRADEVIE